MNVPRVAIAIAVLATLAPAQGIFIVDEQGRVTDFRRTIVVMTSNLGSDLTEDAWIGFANPDASEEVRGRTDKLDMFIELMLPLGLVDVSRTGVVAISRGESGLLGGTDPGDD